MQKALLLFIHGLGGDGTSTWSKGDRPGFLDLVQADESLKRQFDVRVYSYPTSLFSIPFISRPPKIQTLADGLRSQIENRYSSYASIVLVCHSLGGLIARKYLIEEVKNKRPLKVQKLILYAVPNNGAGLTEVAKHVSWRHNQIAQLSRSSDLIEFLNEDWQSSGLAELVIVKFVIASQDNVVTKESAKLFWGNPDTETVVGRGHVDLVKPQDATDDAFVFLKNFIDESRTTDVFVDLSHGQQEWYTFRQAAANLWKDVRFIESSLLRERHKIDRASALVISLPYRSQFSEGEVEYVARWVDRGGGLFLMGYYAADSHHSGNLNLNVIARRLGYEFCDDQVLPEGATKEDCRDLSPASDDRLAVRVQLSDKETHPLSTGVAQLTFRLACSIKRTHGNQPEFQLNSPGTSTFWHPVGDRTPDGWLQNIKEWIQHKKDGAVPLLVAFEYGKGRVVLCGTWKLCSLQAADNGRLVSNIMTWVAAPIVE
jgi:pimeloyl-ACP methyl ester carboxylesterase